MGAFTVKRMSILTGTYLVTNYMYPRERIAPLPRCAAPRGSLGLSKASAAVYDAVKQAAREASSTKRDFVSDSQNSEFNVTI